VTPADAAKTLGIDTQAPRDVVLHRYRELHSQYEARLMAAPISALTKLYQTRLRELRLACETLQSGEIADPRAGLPLVEPLPNDAKTVTDATDRDRHPSVPAASAPQSASGLPSSTVAVAYLAILFATVTAFLVIVWLKDRRTQFALEELAHQQSVRLTALGAQVSRTDQLFESRHLEVCNRSAKPIRIEAVVAVYRDPAGNLRTVHTGMFGYPTWNIAPAARAKLDVLQGRPDDWDGSASFYAIQIAYEGAEPFLIAGLVSDLKATCVNLYLD
jgi:hypothetical protein